LQKKPTGIDSVFHILLKILPNKAGRLIYFSKRFRLRVVGQLIGKKPAGCRLACRKNKLFSDDTVATLLAGKSASIGHDYDSFIDISLERDKYLFI